MNLKGITSFFCFLLLSCLSLHLVLAQNIGCGNGLQIGQSCYCHSGFIDEPNNSSRPCSTQCLNPRSPPSPPPPLLNFQTSYTSFGYVYFVTFYQYGYIGRQNYTASFNGMCQHPSPTFNSTIGTFTKECMTFSVSNENVMSTFQMEELLKCGWNVSGTPSMMNYKGTYELSYVDTLERGLVKKTVERFPITISIPRVITVSSWLLKVVRSPDLRDLEIYARITSQSVNVVSNEMTIELTTQVSYPGSFLTVIPSAVPSYVSIVAPMELSSQQGCFTANAMCTKVWRVTYKLTNGACRFTGNYDYTLVFDCNGASPGCPYNGLTANVTDALVSESLCYSGDFTLSASGYMNFYDSSQYTVSKTSFPDSSTAYGKMFISWYPSFPITVTVTDVTVYRQYSGTSDFLVSAGTLTSLGRTANFTQQVLRYDSDMRTTEIGISFKPIAFIESGNPSAQQSFTISATVQVKYGVNTRTAMIKMQGVQTNSQTSTKVSAELVVTKEQVTAGSPPSLSTFSSITAILAAVTLAVLTLL